MPRAPDISQLTPEQRAERLYDRIMTEHEAGRQDAVRTFMPMAIAAYEMLDSLNLDQRYDLGRLGEVAGDTALARAQADTILAEAPDAPPRADPRRARRAAARRTRRAPARSTHGSSPRRRPNAPTALPEYLLHKNDIDTALAAVRSSPK